MNRTKRRPSVEFLEAREALSGTSIPVVWGMFAPAPAAKIPPAPVVAYQPQTLELDMPCEQTSLNF